MGSSGSVAAGACGAPGTDAADGAAAHLDQTIGVGNDDLLELLAALAQIGAVLAGADPINGLLRVQLCASVQYIIARVEAIEAVKRARKKESTT